MNHYTVPRIGAGTDADPYRPDLPAGTSWVGNTNGADYLVATPADLSDTMKRKKLLPDPPLRQPAEARGFRFEDVATWRVYAE